MQPKKITDKRIGLTIDDTGITDNSNAVSIGHIKWEDITEIKTGSVLTEKFLLIFTKDPDVYLEKAKGIKRKLMAANMNMCGTPITISSNTLKYDFKELEKLVTNRYQNYKK